jgi:hypothetical protein
VKIERMYHFDPEGWQEVSEDEFLRRTEWAGYMKKGTALQTLKDAGELRTTYAIYRVAVGVPA